ncbi:Peptidase M1, membrane alanine aminopeptidase, N-terminal domain-containing protein [Strongyloides ratti]|uniref:Peptidase M1, membrane alanine aminopeptidase, N-terminal domain-containing protein n=1 Tax=Strongyloides ratti TaxID=34506 RepID=A0A090KYS1_STRRB|nr:Peptidase M1, membrane alanine aminopeptidase, N-terminal domain-containing protein [Strongyloides ratti]CEF60374.1 Peptidase M1, membrane alanine aminopeptidase, N-terminal domain-containing protein [Strongyloides ratti]
MPNQDEFSLNDDILFEGKISIRLKTKNPTDIIALNVANASYINPNFENISITDSLSMKKDIIIIKNIEYDGKKEIMYFFLNRSLKVDEVIIFSFDYKGYINKYENLGIFINKTRSSNDTKLYVGTHNQPGFARRFIPCLDEPNYKSVWNVSVIHPKPTKAVGNGSPLLEEDIDDKWKKTTFSPTYKMSSYLFALFVSEFKYIEKEVTHTNIRLWFDSIYHDKAEIILYLNEQILIFLEHYFDYAYQMNHLDIVAIPHLNVDAMENWGLIMFRSKILFEDNENDKTRQEDILITITHELIHQWIGNLITPEWWQHIWLAEGVTQLLTEIVIEKIYHENLSYQIFNRTRKGMFNDFNKTYDLTLEDNFDDIHNYKHHFDIAYSKGYGITKMVYLILGYDLFREAMRLYVKKNKFSNVDSTILFQRFQKIANESGFGNQVNFNLMRKEWVLQKGIPLVDVKRIDNNTLELTQQPFDVRENNELGYKPFNEKFRCTWNIPIWYTVNGVLQKLEWLQNRLTLNVNSSDIYIINPETKGWYLVRYEKDYYKVLKNKITKNTVPHRSYMSVVCDAVWLCVEKYTDCQTGFESTRCIVKAPSN